MKPSFYSYILVLLCALSSLSLSAQQAGGYAPNAILNAPVDYHAIAAFLNSNGGQGGNKAAAPASSGSTANMPSDSGVVVSPTFGAISGPAVVCNQNQQPVTYSVAISSVNGTPVQFYWFLPADWVILSGQNTNTITVMPGSQSGQVAVFAIGFCICSYSCMPVKVDCPTNPPCDLPRITLAGPDSACSFDFENPAVYTASLLAGTADTFVWNVPADWMILDGEGTASISVMTGFDSGTVTVTATNSCGSVSDSVFTAVTDCGFIEPLPVELISFEAARAQSSVLLSWATAQEKDNDRFEVERSLDGRTFTAIGKVQGKGTTSYQSEYSFTDASASKATTYYRLKQVDTNGKYEYSAVRTVKATTGSVALSAYPNPATDVVTLNLSEAESDAVIRLLSVTGQQVWSGTARQLSAQQNRLSLSQLNAGVYVATITSGQGTQSIRIIKN